MHEAVAYIHHYLLTNWHAIATYLLVGGGVSLGVRALASVRKWEHGSTKVKAAGLISSLSAMADWIINNYTTSPLSSLGDIGPRILVAALFMHEVIINPTVKLIAKLVDSNLFSFLGNLKTLKADAAAYRASKAEQASTPTETPFN